VINPLPWHHIHLTHKNREEVADWYIRYLGARRGPGTKRSENLWYDDNLIQVQSDTGIKPPKTGEFGHLGLAFPDVSQVIQTSVDGGASLVEDNQILDPWGTPIQLVESESLGFHHLLILCHGPVESADWYALHLGGEVVACPWHKDYPAIRYDTMWLVFGKAFSAEINPLTPRPICHAGWFTPDIDRTVGEMLASGCSFPVPIRPFGPVRLAFTRDPSGLWIELVEPPGGKIPKQDMST
jgi:catechol 2,3-dioxygenase-like lactoylglutathione lyase family enzyme